MGSGLLKVIDGLGQVIAGQELRIAELEHALAVAQQGPSTDASTLTPDGNQDEVADNG